MEARLYAEDPDKGFLPSIGRLDHFLLPEEHVRIDTGVEEGGEVSQFYDPMIAKLIAQGETREEAAGILADACREVEVWPVRTNAAFLARCLDHADFISGDIDTGFIGAREDVLIKQAPSQDAILAAIALAAEDAAVQVGLPAEGDRQSPWQATPDGIYGFRLNGAPQTTHRLDLDGQRIEGRAQPLFPGEWRWLVSANDLLEEVAVLHEQVIVGERRALNFVRTENGAVIFEHGAAMEVREIDTGGSKNGGAVSDGALVAPMPGKIVAVSAKPGDTVKKGATVVVLEAMKMEQALVAPFDGVVAAVPVEVGQQVVEGALLAKVDAAT
jgi:3-methylcrotonyl-CoA carboxylase alpha subunit